MALNLRNAGINQFGYGTALACTKDSGLRIYALSYQNYIYELRLAGNQWSIADLTEKTGGAVAAPRSPLTCINDFTHSVIRVYYLDANGHILELNLTNGAWSANDLTAITNGAAAASGSALVCAGVSPIIRVYYFDAHNHIWELNLTNGAWSANDLTAITHGIPALTGSALSSMNYGNGVRVYYIGASNNIYELTLQGGAWSNTNLNTGIFAQLGSLACALGDKNTIHVFYLNNQNWVVDLYFDPANNLWHSTNLTGLNGIPALAQSPLSCTLSGSSVAVFYLSAEYHILQCNLTNTTWSSKDLTASSGGTSAGTNVAIPCMAGLDGNLLLHFWARDFNLDQLQSTPNGIWQQEAITETVSFQEKIKHIVVVMFENRSLDNLCGWLYSSSQPNLVLPAGSSPNYSGLNSGLWNPSNESYFSGAQPAKAFVVKGTTATNVPDVDPGEVFDNVTYQLYGPASPKPDPQWPTLGFLVNYEKQKPSNSGQIMQTYSPDQAPMLTFLAENFAISDGWFCSVPSETWPNRAFACAGTSNGHVNNGAIPNPLEWNVPTIFGTLAKQKYTWAIYSDTSEPFLESLTANMFLSLRDYPDHFKTFEEFETACSNNTLPQYSFIEPNFGFFCKTSENDYHPPSDVLPAEAYLRQIYNALSASQAWNETLLIVTFDEHGGCYDHVLPPLQAKTPDSASNPGEENFHFDRFGVRVPAILVSPYIQAGTVFRSDTQVPLDHTSILATIRDWLQISPANMLTSARIAAAPTVFQVLTLQTARTDVPKAPEFAMSHQAADPHRPLNDLHKSIIAGMATRFGHDAAAALEEVTTAEKADAFVNRIKGAAAAL